MSKLIVSVLNLCRQALEREAAKQAKKCEACDQKTLALREEHAAECEAAWDAYAERVKRADEQLEYSIRRTQDELGKAACQQQDAERWLNKLS